MVLPNSGQEKPTALDSQDHQLYRGFGMDGEQREVYEAAMIIQRAYREYRARSSSQRQADVERRAAVTIQSFYRRYKKFCYFKKLHNAAIVVQKHFRMKKNRDEQGQGDTSSVLEVPEHPTLHGESIRIQIPQTNSTLALLREHRAATTIQHAYRGHRNRKRQAAARKIQKFMKENRQKFRRMAQNESGMASAPMQLVPQQVVSQMNTNYNMPGSSSYILKQM
ncbi:hypothetical protein WR25_17817 [Diploscapter pachys]|uniref:Calmodulin-binding transcription activator 1 n=1 Tax=Diploscapter pachys TaxID=2018661 RepID=A0A2A2KN98_9BILA|nr:hypothetical protein WR25_17817 [Diploscapter pachys]